MSGPVKKRSYTSTVRREQAARTRGAIVEAAASLFTTRGYARTTVQAVAAEAGVAPDTVYAVFGSKVRLLTAVIDARLAPPGVANVMDRDETQAVRREPDQRRQVHLFARDMARLSTRVRPVFEVLRVAADAEPEVRSVYEEMERHRLANMRRVAEWLGANGPLTVDVDAAAHTIWVLASPDAGRLLCDVRGWSEDAHAAWLESTLAGVLLPPRPGVPGPRRHPR
jgi:AcrR family transcriptional regulator